MINKIYSGGNSYVVTFILLSLVSLSVILFFPVMQMFLFLTLAYTKLVASLFYFLFRTCKECFS